jgi:hypothetical protein
MRRTLFTPPSSLASQNQDKDTQMNLPKCLLLLCIIIVGLAATAQTPGGPQQLSNPFPEHDNQWHLGYSVQSFDSNPTFSEEKATGMGDRDAKHPMEVTGIYTDPDNKVALANPPVVCVNTGPAETNACVFTSTGATQNDQHSIRYTFRNWGGRCTISLRVLHYKPVADWKWADPTPWSNGSPFIVVVPEQASPQGSAVVFGRLNGANIFFAPSDPLSATDATHFTLLEPKKVVPGLGTIYRFHVK